jgi:hypothetical protein
VVAAGRKKKRKIYRGRGPTVAVAGRWLCWFLVVEMVVENLTVMTVVAWMEEREREYEEIDGRKGKIHGRKLVFLAVFGPQISPPLEHEDKIYLQAVEEGHFVSSGAKSQPLVQPESISTIGLK